MNPYGWPRQHTYSGCDRDDIFCTCSRHVVFPIHRINLRWGRTNSRFLRLAYTPFPTLLDWEQSLNTFKDRPDLLNHAAPLPLIAAQFTTTAVQVTFFPDWSQFSDLLRSGKDHSPVEWGYKHHCTINLACRDWILANTDSISIKL